MVAFMGMGFPQVDGIMELYKLVDSGSKITNEAELGDAEAIIRQKPTTIDSWVELNAAGFH